MVNLYNILFLDIETVSVEARFKDLSDRYKMQWAKKADRLKSTEDQTIESLYNRAGIYAEFGKVVSIAVGYFVNNSGPHLRVKSIANHNEKELLTEFVDLINMHFNKSDLKLCAHNGKEFDFPYLARRLVINSLKIPDVLNTSGKKPWEVKHYDTMEMWKFGDYKNFTSLDLLATLFNIDSSKDDIDGSQVNGVYHQTKDLERISNYCKNDVVVLAQVFLRLNQMPALSQDKIALL
ncbi:3'-5' exonuclease [Roseivirga sp.]|uniref:3'-5' exonuclease n=1 Tax=Roseivirga sp. TaxID=1964215 RepID=UPI003B8E0D25